ncbi:MAG: potassium-transporting ATPase subunit KdpA [Gemmataceae bacterium]
MWLIPLLVLGLSVALSIPLGRYMAWILDPKPGTPLARNSVERLLATGPQHWKSYCVSMLLFNAIVFAIGFAVLAFQHHLPLNPDDKKELAPTTVFNTACSFLTNTNLQHYSGEVHLSYFSQIFFVLWKQFLTPAIGLCALLAVIRGLRGDDTLGCFALDLFRGVVYLFLPLSLVVGLLLILTGIPMTFEGAVTAKTVEGADQVIARGPVAAIVAIKQLGSNGGGFFGVNSCHPFENPNAGSNLIECICILIVPMACVVLFGRMLKAERQAAILFVVCLVMVIAMTITAVALESTPNPGLNGLPVDQSTGNLEGKELRFGAGAAGTWVVATTCTSNGSVNCMHDSLNPLTGTLPLAGMWLNCLFGGVGVGFINMFVYVIVGVFLAGLMVGRTPEYLGKKVEAREMKLAMLALLIHPLLVLAPTGLFCQTGWADAAKNNPGPHGFSETLYEFSSASANNGSGFEGLADTVGTTEEHDDDLKDEKKRDDRLAARSVASYWDISTGLVMLIGRFVPIIAPIALAAGLARKKPTPFTAGTLRTDTITFGVVVLGSILLVGALLFLPAAALGPIAEHLSLVR